MSLNQLVGNRRAYAVQREDGTYYPVREPITGTVLKKHTSGEQTIGTYLLIGSKARTLVLDFDSGDTAESEAIAARDALAELGLPSRSLGVEFSGNKGYHVWLVVATPVEASLLRRIGRAALGLAQVEAEIYPKQDKATDLGNLVKLPGGIHQVTKKRNDWIGSAPQPCSSVVIQRVAGALPEEPKTRGGEAPPPLQCMAAIQEGIEEGGRNHALFHFTVMLRRSGLAEDLVAGVVDQVNSRFDPPLDLPEVDSVLESSKRSGPICNQIPRDIQCEECPVRRPKGLYAKPGQMKFAGEGELVVLELAKRYKNGNVRLSHPDIEEGLCKMRST